VERKDLRLLTLFTRVYCRDHHMPQGYPLCPECRDLLRYARQRRQRCPLDPKPVCKKCPVHCYKPVHRQQVRKIMRYSGMTLVKRGRLDLLWHYFF
jgi:hypothetical protein